MDIKPSGEALGASITGIDLAKPVADADFKIILRALGEHGVICFPRQRIDTEDLARFGKMFGDLEINVANLFHEPDHPEVMILSNMKKDGKADRSRRCGPGLAYRHELQQGHRARQCPVRAQSAHARRQAARRHAVPQHARGLRRTCRTISRTRLEGRTATHDFIKFWDMMRARPGTQRGPLTPEQRRQKPPVSQPIFQTHPITGRSILYCNPGYAMHIDGMDKKESDELLEYLFKHQENPKFFYAHKWAEGDVLMWDNIGTVHNAVPDYGPDEPRYMRRIQVMATKDYARLAA